MPVPTHFRYVVRGSFLNSPEAWSFGMHFSRDVAANPDAGLDDVREDDVDGALRTFMECGKFGDKVQVDDWRFYEIGTNGKMQGNGPKIRLYDPAELTGTVQGTRHPPQVALAVSLFSENRGAAQQGRFYLPGVNIPVENDWRISASNAQDLLAFTVSFLKDTSDAIDLVDVHSANLINVSKGPAGSGTGTKQPVDHIGIGRAYDTIRNRRKSLDEDRQLSGHIDW